MPRSAPSLSALLLPALLVGCAPNDATIKNGNWMAWFASNSSSVVENDDISGIDDNATIYSCSEFADCAGALYASLDGVDVPSSYDFADDGLAAMAQNANLDDINSFSEFRAFVEAGVYATPPVRGGGPAIGVNALDNCVSGGWDPVNGRFLNSYQGAQLSGDHSDPRFVGGSCAYEYDAETVGPAIDENGRIEYIDASCTDENINEIINECGTVVETRMRHGLHDWMSLDNFHAMRGTIEPWRTEAMVNGEGDLQLTIHFRVDGEDVYFSWTIDPDFSPEQCLSTGDGTAESIGVDGGDWVSAWSEDEDGHDIYYLNAGALQVNGSETWYLPIDWLAGFGHANFIGEEFFSEPPKYGNYYNEFFNFAENEQSFYSVPDRNVLDGDDAMGEAEVVEMQEGWAEALRAYADLWELEMINGAHAFTGSASSPDWTFEHKIEDNIWRAPDVRPTGIDGWMELHESWVRIKSGSKLEPGGTAKGDFQIVYTGSDSFSRLVVKGEFDIENIREDRWAYPELEEELRDSDFGQAYCR